MSVFSCIAVLTPELVIGRGNALPWHLPADLRHFKAVTLGKPVLMGRKTWDSLGRPLPDRRNLVLSRDPAFAPPGCEVFRSLEGVLELAHTPQPPPEIMVIGGAEIYRLLLPYSRRLYLTWVEADIHGDAWFPAPDWRAWREISRQQHPADEKNPFPYAFVVLERA
jgi:dihydrofolate reductase